VPGGFRMKFISCFIFLFSLFQLTLAQSVLIEANDKKAELEQNRQEHLAGLLSARAESQEGDFGETGKISPGKAILFSAILPGSGEAYAGSWKKAILFFAAEVTGFAVNVTYNRKGDDKQDELEDYADMYWSAQKYWTSIYYRAEDKLGWEITGFNPDPDNPESWLSETQIDEHMDLLREMETEYSHSLPSRKTQQYYEMIGKYVGQFGYGWDDAGFDDDLYGYDSDKITDDNITYVKMRKKSEEFYDTATKASQFIILNHLISAVDAGFTARIKNKKVAVVLEGDVQLVRNDVMEFVGVGVHF